jgi:deazaflavin-dependent oxidoreductase (nitroreductase family)
MALSVRHPPDHDRGMGLHADLTRWLYKGGRPNRIARVVNRAWAYVFATGIRKDWVATLEVKGRKSGRTISFPVVIAEYDRERYLVAMLGERTGWVRNVEAAGGAAVLRAGGRQDVHLEPVPADERSPILLRYLAVAPGARPHIPVDRNSAPEEIAAAAAHLPTFRIEAPRPIATAEAAPAR